ncbi:hypothetical protein H5410_009435 [Solanum commersonii]|uniref:LOB domain-containing protein n=1 Tax=Solanum commersonii TaxID=4109 RepID=A0A9J6AIF1_SOLCO|nr:hypothetical protein H5410_009435 [Solanum commersonii]
MEEAAVCAACRYDGHDVCVENCQWRGLFPLSQIEKFRRMVRIYGKATLSREYRETPPLGRAHRFETMHRDALVQEVYRHRGGIAGRLQELENVIQQKDQQIAHLQGTINIQNLE